MTRTMIALVSTVALVLASSVTMSAQGKKGSTPKPQHVSSAGTTTKGSSPKTTTAGPKTSGPKTTTASQTAKGPKTTTARATGKTTTSSPATTSARANAKTTTKTAKADTTGTKRERTSSATATGTTTATTPTTGDTDTPPVTLTRVQERLQKNTKLAEKLEGRLPRRTDLMEAAEGFRNLGQFVAAVNVSANLGLDFEKLKLAMVDDGKSLGQAIQIVKRDVENPTVVAQRAESEALTLIQQTENTATTTTTTTTGTTTRKTTPKDKPKRSGS